MPSNRVYPERQDYDTFSVSTFDSRRSMTFQHNRDCTCCFKRKCFCISGMVLLTLGAISAFITLGVIFGIPKNGNVYTRECRTSLGKAGFLCDDRRTCIGPSALCNGQVDCANGEDESRTYCSNLPNNLPEGLVFRCANRKIWTYTDKLCDNKNDCGDCSDESVDHSCVEESGSQSNMQIFKSLHCPACQGWRCNTVFFADCDCIPKTRCNDTVQDCIDWSDEISCR